MQFDFCIAQKNKIKEKGEWELSVGAAISQAYSSDPYFTSQIYSGVTAGGSLAVKYKKTKSFHDLSVYFLGGTLNASKQSSLNNIYFNIEYANLYNITSTNNALKIFVGGGIDILYAERDYNNFVNNNYSFDFSTSLSGVFEISYLINKRFSISGRLTVPVVSAVEQPSFGSEDPSGDNGTGKSRLSAFFSGAHILSFSSFVRLKNSLDLTMQLSTRQKLSLAYTWDYYKLDDVRKVRNVNNGFRLIYCYTF